MTMYTFQYYIVPKEFSFWITWLSRLALSGSCYSWQYKYFIPILTLYFNSFNTVQKWNVFTSICLAQITNVLNNLISVGTIHNSYYNLLLNKVLLGILYISLLLSYLLNKISNYILSRQFLRPSLPFLKLLISSTYILRFLFSKKTKRN